jgi:hypothetical protein
VAAVNVVKDGGNNHGGITLNLTKHVDKYIKKVLKQFNLFGKWRKRIFIKTNNQGSHQESFCTIAEMKVGQGNQE